VNVAARLTPQQKLLRTIPESQFQKDVQKVLDAYGWIWYHAADNVPRGGYISNIKAGFPDIVAARGSRILFAELKRETGRLSDDQVRWQDAVLAAGQEHYVWYPHDMETIKEVLARR
jgi:hypothetical protein